MTDQKAPQWGYRLKGGEVEARLFEQGRPPRGWADSPAKVKRDDDSTNDS